ncbi:MAG: hypothetical protein GWN00_28125 [Aliifodinibius sp.]|nr:hypothetical protein [candidate division Zixibacteria bacterium]NIT59947.1 hypothetical protein [Fodinibius sp.]NIW47373.1 hypothetical protein [Gammaproteobacteria bacterium]NIS47849.1 hypothetical protein [candidate division Zixibacteria bacterium]NIU15949.1 hypothetical protein [candidate division Zixibacteria bacterium]
MDHQRVNVPSVNLVLGSQQNVAHSLQFGSIAISGNLNSGTEKRYYQFNVSNLVNNYLYGARNVNDIYLGIGSNTGISRSTLIYNENAPEHLRPKIVIAFLEEGEQQ